MYPHNYRIFNWVSAYSPRQESRLKTYWCRWNFEENNRKSSSFSNEKRYYFVSWISTSMCRLWSWCEVAIYTMDLIFNDQNTDAILLIDAKNAFNLINKEAFIHNVKMMFPVFGTFVSNCYSSSSRVFIIGGGELKSTEGTTQVNPIALIIYVITTISLILMIIEIMYDQPGNISTLAAYADDFTATRTLTELKVLWDILCSLVPIFWYYPWAPKSCLIVKKYRIKRASILI